MLVYNEGSCGSSRHVGVFHLQDLCTGNYLKVPAGQGSSLDIQSTMNARGEFIYYIYVVARISLIFKHGNQAHKVRLFKLNQ